MASPKISGSAAKLLARMSAQDNQAPAQPSPQPAGEAGTEPARKPAMTGAERLFSQGTKQALEDAEKRAAAAEERVQILLSKLESEGRHTSELQIAAEDIVPSRFYNRSKPSLDPAHPVMQAFIQQIAATNGNVQRALCVPRPNGKFEIVFGERRSIACRELGLPLNSFVAELTDAEILEFRIAENTGKQELSVWAMARQVAAYKKIVTEMTTSDDVDPVSKAEAFFERLGFSRQHHWRLETIAKLPESLERDHPDVDGISQRELLDIAKLFEDNAPAFTARLKEARDKGLNPKESTLHILQRKPQAKQPVTLKVSKRGLQLSVACTPEQAKSLAAEIEAVMKRLRIHG